MSNYSNDFPKTRVNNTLQITGLHKHLFFRWFNSTSHCRAFWICVYFRQWLLGSHTGLHVNHTAAAFLGETNTNHTKTLLVLMEGKER